MGTSTGWRSHAINLLPMSEEKIEMLFHAVDNKIKTLRRRKNKAEKQGYKDESDELKIEIRKWQELHSLIPSIIY